MAHGDTQEGKWRGNWRMEWVASTLHTTSEHGVSSIATITTADAHTSVASSRLNWHPCRFKWTHPVRQKTKSGFCAFAITFQTQSTTIQTLDILVPLLRFKSLELPFDLRQQSPYAFNIRHAATHNWNQFKPTDFYKHASLWVLYVPAFYSGQTWLKPHCFCSVHPYTC
jgi:hypothetical protein